MLRAPLLSFLAHAYMMPVYVIGDHAYVKSLTSSGRQARKRLASLATEARLMPERCAQASGRLLPMALTLRDYVQNVEAIRFTMGELIPYLRLLGAEDEADGQDDRELQYLITEFVALAAEIRRLFNATSFTTLNGAELAGLLHAPCVIAEGLIVPLRPASREVPTEHVEFCYQGHRFVREHSRALCLADVIKSVEEAVYDRLFEIERGGREASLMTCFARTVNRLLALHRPVRGSVYDELYVDRFHRVQFRRGQSVLIRGPARKVCGVGHCYVGLRIGGRRREQLLSRRPTEVETPTGFWTRDGRPREGGICMGTAGQYRWLYADWLTDTEAVVQWLDAATWIATERAALHGMWRRRKSIPSRRLLRDWLARTT